MFLKNFKELDNRKIMVIRKENKKRISGVHLYAAFVKYYTLRNKSFF